MPFSFVFAFTVINIRPKMEKKQRSVQELAALIYQILCWVNLSFCLIGWDMNVVLVTNLLNSLA